MIDKITSSTSSASQFRVKSSTENNGQEGAAAIQPQSEEKEDTPQYQSYPFVERRSGKDRRQQKQKRVIYDMRQNGGRRKTDRKYPPIETDA